MASPEDSEETMSNQRQLSPYYMLRRMALSLVIVAGSLLMGCGSRQLMPTPNLYVNSSVDPFAEVVPAYQTNEVELLYATDRLPIQDNQGNLDYSSGRSTSLAFGSCVVEIRQVIKFELVASPGLAQQTTNPCATTSNPANWARTWFLYSASQSCIVPNAWPHAVRKSSENNLKVPYTC